MPNIHLRRPSVVRIVSPALFALILISFALPFGTVSCNGPDVQFTGYQLATWRVQQTIPPATTDDGGSLPAKVESDASFVALLALAAAVAGLVLGLAGRLGAGIAATAGLFFSAILFVIPFGEMADTRYEIGFELMAGLYAVLALWHLATAFKRRHAPVVTRHDASSFR